MKELLNIIFAASLAAMLFTGTIVVMEFLYRNHSFDLFIKTQSEEEKEEKE